MINDSVALPISTGNKTWLLRNYSNNENDILGESHGLVVKAEDSWSRDRGFEPRPVYVLDGCKRISQLAITYTKITKIKVAEWGTPK